MKLNVLNLARHLMRCGLLAAAISLTGCGGPDSAGNQEPEAMLESSQEGHSQALAAARKGTDGSEADSGQDMVRGNGIYLTLSKDDHSILKSSDSLNWQIAFTHDKRKFRELSFVAAAGNSGADPVVENRDACHVWPAHHPSVIAVGSYERNNQAQSWFSNMGSCIALFAPSEEIQFLGRIS